MTAGSQNSHPPHPSALLGARMKAASRFMAQADVFSWALLWLMVVLVVGTLAQKYIGLYQAHRLYFDAWFIWFGGFVPLPGTRLVLLVIFTGLCAKLSLQPWTRHNAGSLIVHIGAILLLLGGFITGVFSSEGSVLLDEGGRSAAMSDYYKIELAVVDETSENDPQTAAVFGEDLLSENAVLRHESMPFDVTIEGFYRHVAPTRRAAIIDDVQGVAVHGMRKAIQLKSLPRMVEEEANLSGLDFTLTAHQSKGAEGETSVNGAYSLIESAPVIQSIEHEGRLYRLYLRHARSALPFSVTLKDFRKQSHPGTMQARSYESDVVVQDGDLTWESTISMNSPLRYKGYTLYQASFLQRPDGSEASVFAVVRNHGRLFPYISTIIMCVGLLIHLMVRLPRLTAPPSGREDAASATKGEGAS